jgi:hypothetical protein
MNVRRALFDVLAVISLLFVALVGIPASAASKGTTRRAVIAANTTVSRSVAPKAGIPLSAATGKVPIAPAVVMQPQAVTATPPTVLVYGDSLATQSETYIDSFASLNGAAQVVNDDFPGSMPCTWMTQIDRKSVV